MLAGADIAPLLPQVKVPTLVIAPSRSPLTSLSDQLTIRNSIPDAQMALVEGPGHEIYVDEPEQCINALLRFLGGRDDPGDILDRKLLTMTANRHWWGSRQNEGLSRSLTIGTR
jgi:hypothetical protein